VRALLRIDVYLVHDDGIVQAVASDQEGIEK